MAELDLFRDFNRGVAAPSGDARRRALAIMTGAIDGELARGHGHLPRVRSRRGGIALAFAALVGAVAVALFVSTPWKTAPGFSLEEVQAAITPPEGTILHASWTVTRTSNDYGCTVTLGPNEMWADLSPPYSYREIDSLWPSADAVDRRSAACDENESVTTERGGTRITDDEVALLREALADGTAHDEGQVELDGRVVERIRVDAVFGTRYFYVDRETFMPVQVVGPPEGPLFEAGLGPMRFHIVKHYLTYEYLPRTEENLALTDIRAQHPDAIGP